MKPLIRRTLRTAGTLVPGVVAWWLGRQLMTPRPAPQLPLALPNAAAKRWRVAFHDTHVAVTEWGEGPAVLLVHGWGGRSESFLGLVDPLVGAGLRPVALDLPAHGRSGGARTSMIQCAAAVRAVAEALGAVHAVVGHSFGGPTVALAVTRGLDVTRVVMAAPPRSVHEALRTMALDHGVPEAVFAQVAREFEQRLEFEWPDLDTARLASRLTVPLLIIHDDSDRVTPLDDGLAVAAAVPGATFVRTSGLGHRGVLADPQVVEQVAAFLRP
jgi:pimeloyl-ACP methyl ester carboxylesterase